MRFRSRWLGGVALVLAGTVSGCSSPGDGGVPASTSPGGSADGICAPLPVLVEPTRVAADEEISIRGTGALTCPDETVRRTTPLEAIDLVLVHGSRRTILATVDADAEGNFDVSARIPTDATAGTAVVSVDVRDHLPSTVEVEIVG